MRSRRNISCRAFYSGAAVPGLIVLSALYAAAVPAPAAAQSDADLDEFRAKFDYKRRLLDIKQRRQTGLSADLKQIDQERERLAKRLVETAKAVQNSERRLTTIEQRLGELSAQETILRGSLDQNRDTITKLLGAMQRMGRNPPPVVITRRSDVLQMVRSALLLAATFPELSSQAKTLAGKLDELLRVVTESRLEAKKLRAETARLTDKRTSLSALLEERRQAYGKRQAELSVLRREAEKIKKSVSSLGELITRLDQAVAARTALGVYNDRTKVAALARPRPQAAPQQPQPQARPAAQPAQKLPVRPLAPVNQAKIARPAPPKPPIQQKPPTRPKQQIAAAIIKPAPPKPPAAQRPPDSVVIAPTAALAPLSSGRLQPAKPFNRTRGALPFPAQGRQVVAFGERTQYGARSKGIVIETRGSAQVTSSADGWVVYAGEFRSYGQLLIMNAGGGYHILLAGLSRIDVELGQFVLAGEPVGVMAAAARKSQAKAQDNAPVLYVEFRKQGRPIDPGPWWVKDSNKVQG